MSIVTVQNECCAVLKLQKPGETGSYQRRMDTLSTMLQKSKSSDGLYYQNLREKSYFFLQDCCDWGENVVRLYRQRDIIVVTQSHGRGERILYILNLITLTLKMETACPPKPWQHGQILHSTITQTHNSCHLYFVLELL
jgi:hypothetical protein